MRLCVLGLLGLLVAISACSPGADDASLGYTNKGCLGKGPNCGYDPNARPSPSADEEPHVPPEGCPDTRPDGPRTNLIASEVRGWLPGLYRSCSGGHEMAIVVDEHGGLVVDNEPLVIGTCGTTLCDAAWGSDLGSLHIWSDPTAFTFTVDGFEQSYVRLDD